jgi:hypothetical protein
VSIRDRFWTTPHDRPEWRCERRYRKAARQEKRSAHGSTAQHQSTPNRISWKGDRATAPLSVTLSFVRLGGIGWRNNVLRCQASVAPADLSCEGSRGGCAAQYSQSSVLWLRRGSIPSPNSLNFVQGVFTGLAPPSVMMSIYLAAVDARAVWPVHSYVLTSSALPSPLKRPRHGDPSAQADEHPPHLQSASICQPAAATCQATQSRWLRSSVPARL